MELGQVVDYIVEWNDAHNKGDTSRPEKKKEEPKRRAATQADIDAFWG